MRQMARVRGVEKGNRGAQIDRNRIKEDSGRERESGLA